MIVKHDKVSLGLCRFDAEFPADIGGRNDMSDGCCFLVALKGAHRGHAPPAVPRKLEISSTWRLLLGHAHPYRRALLVAADHL